MQRQIERYRGKHFDGRRDGKTAAEVLAEPTPMEEESTGVISRRKTFELTPMDEAEAFEQMQMLGHDNFFIFFNAKTEKINVLYKRSDQTYGIIEPRIR
jgi:putative sigma-54 modulation protein